MRELSKILLILLIALLIPILHVRGRTNIIIGTATTSISPPGTITPDIGPPYSGAVPAAATQAGFTKLALNYDFTYTSSWTDFTSHQWCAGTLPCSQANMSSWFTCSWNTASPYLIVYGFNFGPAVPCDANHQTIISDGGKQALALYYSYTDEQAGYADNSLVSVNNTTTTSPFDPKDHFRAGHYMEAVYRFTQPAACGNDGCTIGDISTFNADPTSNNACFIVHDNESDSNNQNGMGATFWNNNPCGTSGCAGPNPPGCGVNGIYGTSIYSPVDSNYHTVANLLTIDTVNNNVGLNGYIASGVVNGLTTSATFVPSCCGASNAPSVPANVQIAATPVFMYIKGGPQQLCGSGTFGACNWQSGVTGSMIIRSIRVWTCPSYLTAPCVNTPVITSHP